MAENKQICKNCKWFSLQKFPEEFNILNANINFGWCHLYPPKKLGSFEDEFTQVKTTDWCGQWKPKE